MTVVIGTAGHIDHGKTTLLRALTGIDGDRLPEEQRRGMTIDVGYAHFDLEDGTSIDFVDVPGHDALIGNMLVGAGEIDAAMLVVAADDGPRAQTLEHLELLDALGLRDGLAVITKLDVAGASRAAEVASEVADLLARSSLTGSPVHVVASPTGQGLDEIKAALLRLRARVLARAMTLPAGPVRLAIDRSFIVKGRGAVVTGTLRGGPLRIGDALRLEPGGRTVRVRGLQVHHGAVEVAAVGRAAVNLSGAGLGDLSRGAVLTTGSGVERTDRILVAVTRPTELGASMAGGPRPDWPPRDGARVRLHIWTAQVEAIVGRRGRDAVELPDGSPTVVLRLAKPLAVAAAQRGILRRSSPGDLLGGIRVLDAHPPRGISRRRIDVERLAALASAFDEGDIDRAGDALVAMHGVLSNERMAALAGALRREREDVAADRRPGLILAPDIRAVLEEQAIAGVKAQHRDHPLESGLAVTTARRALGTALRRLAAVRREAISAADDAIGVIVADLVSRKRLARDGDRLRDPGIGSGPSPALAASMDRLEMLLDVPAPPDLAVAARTAGCPPDGVHALEASGRLIRVAADLAWAAPAFERLAATALTLARSAPLTPAALRDATGTSRRYVVPLIEDLDRRGILARTPAGHVPGPRAPHEPARRS